MSEGKTPTLPDNSFYTLFSFFHLFFLPSFSFCIGMRPVSLPLGNRALPISPGVPRAGNKSFTGRSKTVHTSGGQMGYTKHVDKGSRNPEPTSLPIFYFSFTPLFQICVVNRQSAVVSFPPTSGGASPFVRTVPVRTRGCTAAKPRLHPGLSSNARGRAA